VLNQRQAGGDEAQDRQSATRGVPGRTDEPHILERVAAEKRVERYLDGFGMARGRRRELVVQGCVARAIERWREQRASDVPQLALEQAEETVANWFRAVLGEEVVGEGSPLLLGRAAFELCEAAGRWPGVLATCDRLPLAPDGAAQQASLRAIPEELPGMMLEQALEPWSAQDMLGRLRGVATRWVRGLGGTPAAP